MTKVDDKISRLETTGSIGSKNKAAIHTVVVENDTGRDVFVSPGVPRICIKSQPIAANRIGFSISHGIPIVETAVSAPSGAVGFSAEK